MGGHGCDTIGHVWAQAQYYLFMMILGRESILNLEGVMI